MPRRSNDVPIPGSDRPAPPGQAIGAPSPAELLHVTILLRAATPAPGLAERARALADQPSGERRYLSRAEFTDQHGASAADVELVRQFARDYGLQVARVTPAARSVEVTGTTAQLEAAFGVDLGLFQIPEGVIRGRSGPVSVPDWLAPSIEAVLGLDTRPQAGPHFQVHRGRGWDRFQPAATPAGSFTPPELAQLYAFPTGNGAGQTIGIIELGGGYRPADLAHYFSSLGIDPAPQVIAVPVDGAANQPTGDPNSADGEVLLDIEVAGAVAPAATVVVYFAPNTDRGFLDAVNAAVHDEVHQVTAISISWGQSESGWTAQAMDAMNSAFQAASLLGISVFCATGDNGSGDGEGDGLAHADFPSSSPYAVACGGTTLQASGGTISSETVWAGSGGGVSDHFPVPPYQASLNPTSANPGGRSGRGTPDVSAVADPTTGYQVYVDGQALVFGGTSAVAPLWAGLTTLVQQAAGHPVAPLQPTLYPLPTTCHDIVAGSNGAYHAAPGWDECSGLGSPIGTSVLAAVTGTAPPGEPPSAAPEP